MNIYKYSIFNIFNCPKFGNSKCNYCYNYNNIKNIKNNNHTNVKNNTDLCCPHKYLEFDYIK